MKTKAYIICGPTASGKSALALQMAKDLNGIIINADSQQVYKELPILTACPSQSDYDTIPHKLYQFFDGNKKMDVALWVEYAKKEIEEAISQNKAPIIVGGTGFYIKALTEGLATIPPIAQEIRDQVRAEGATKESSLLFETLKTYDPELCKKILPSDKQRILRGIEVFRATGTPLSIWQKQKKVLPLPDMDFDIKIIDFPIDTLEKQITKRARCMINEGVIEEVENLLALHYPNDAPIFKVIGVQTIKNFLSGTMTQKEMEAELILLTRQYAKRQRTFFHTQLCV